MSAPLEWLTGDHRSPVKDSWITGTDPLINQGSNPPHNAVLKLMEDHSSSVDLGMKVLKDYFSTIYKSDERPESFKLNFPNRLPFEVNLPGALVLDGFTDIEPL
jgi:hypothetical protein